MNRRNFFLSLLATAAPLVLPGCGQDRRSAADAAPSAESPSESNEIIAYKKENQAILKAADQRQEEQERMARAVARTRQYRWRVQYTDGDAWSKFINQHIQVFRMLRQDATQSSTETVHCTICDGRGQVDFCVACKDTGKCPTCGGTGTLPVGEICPTCQGNGKCFLCHGAGKMACPFCDDGLVYANQPDPPDKLPID